ncbi:BT4734/BF3469 family protein [Hymenobacter sp. BT730]|uniref:BT4734/BF3469 family protein n=1 Tax=Hymenobacter sp. BT730 TaxID=3063332 RepID=UPI0026DFB895|nr:BT4734/BF3469 family protein [Hymenobacter sp. BT730]
MPNTLFSLPQAASDHPERVVPAAPGERSPRFSYFTGGIRSILPHAAISPGQLYQLLVSPRFQARTEALRAAGRGSPAYTRLKSSLDYVTPAGTFTRRHNHGLQQPSGLLVLDFDKLPDVSAARQTLLNDPHLGPAIVLLFTSPSGDGLKCLLPTNPHASYRDSWHTLEAYLRHHYSTLGLTPDPAGKDVARACFVAHDPDAYLHPNFHHFSPVPPIS